MLPVITLRHGLKYSIHTQQQLLCTCEVQARGAGRSVDSVLGPHKAPVGPSDRASLYLSARVRLKALDPGSRHAGR